MKPYGTTPGIMDTGEAHPSSKSRLPTAGGSYTASATEIARIRRRLKKRARRQAVTETRDALR